MMDRAFVKLRPSMFYDYMKRNVEYLKSLADDNLLLYFRNEAGLINMPNERLADKIHWGWDGPFSQIHGQFCGHWLSGAARLYKMYGDMILKVRIDYIIGEIAHCQAENGGQWAFPIPEKRLHWLKAGKTTWAPQYVCHKVMMGLLDAYLFADNRQALDVLLKCADWFYDFTNDITRENMDEMMDIEETGALMELWADLYGVTKDEKHLELMRRYERPRLFEPLLRGEDPLTNQHANATDAEIHGPARAYEVTGERRYLDIALAYWDMAVERRGTFVTGGTTSGEMYQPIKQQAARLGDKNQEHCVVYNLMRLADYLFRWTGEAKYADFFEQNLYNGILAQGHFHDKIISHDPDTRQKDGRVAYYLPLEAGARKFWGSDLGHFWCCHDTLVQAAAIVQQNSVYSDASGISLAQFLPMDATAEVGDVKVELSLRADLRTGDNIRILDIQRQVLSRPNEHHHILSVSGQGARFELRVRMPGWSKAPLQLFINGEPVDYETKKGFACVSRPWGKDEVRIVLTSGIYAWPLPDRPDTVAFIDGPVAYCAQIAEERTLYGDIEHPESFLVPDNEREWCKWLPYYRTINQPVNFRFVPIYEIGHEAYTVYFPVRANAAGE